MGWEPWMKFAILGSTYAKALQNAAQRAGRNVDALRPALSNIAAQPQATLRPGLSSFIREPGALKPSPSQVNLQNMMTRVPWATEEHGGTEHAVDTLNTMLKRRGLDQKSPAGQPTVNDRIKDVFGKPSREAPEEASQTVKKDLSGQAKKEPRDGNIWDLQDRRKKTPGAIGLPESTRITQQPQAKTVPLRVIRGLPNEPTVSSPSPYAKTAPLPVIPQGATAVLPRTISGPRFPRAGFTTGKVGAALPTAVGLGIPLAVGAGMLATKPGIQSNIHNLMSGKGTTQEQDLSGEIPEPVMQQAQAIHQHLVSRGLDPRAMRIGIDAPPGSGKTTLARALANQTGMSHYGLDWEPGNAWKSTIGLGRNVEKMPHAPRAGEIMEHYLLNRTHDPELFDAQIHLKRDPDVIRQQLNRRGNAAYISDLMDLDKSLGVADLGFDTLEGDTIDLGNGTVMKLRPHAGWGNQLDRRLLASGIDPTGLSRHEKLLTLHSGQRTTGGGWTPYLKNPLSSGETFALGASVPLGMMAARALTRRPI